MKTHAQPGRIVRRANRFVSALTVALVMAGCAASESDAGSALRHTGFRIRSNALAGLNDDVGWAGAANEGVTVSADVPFRIRFEIEQERSVTAARPFRLQVRRNDAEWVNVSAADFPYPDEIASPRVSVVATRAYQAGTPTANLLHGSGHPFQAGAGISLDSMTAAWSGNVVHGEWEWPVVIRRFADSALTNNAGDRFEFRMTADGGPPVAGGSALVTLAIPPRHLGGTFVETPGRLGPWQAASGSLYFIMEPAETWNVMMMVRSTDGGMTWNEVDGANRPVADDLEGFATAVHQGRIHMLHQTSDVVWYHSFRTSDDPVAPDSWDVRDEQVATPSEPPTQVADLAVRTDGSVVAVFGDSSGLRYRIRSPDGTWGSENRIDGQNLSGPAIVSGADEVVYLAYTGSDGQGGRGVWARRIEHDGRLGGARLLASGVGPAEEDVGAVLPLVFLADGTVVVIYRLANGELWERRIPRSGSISPPVRIADRRVVQGAVDSDQVGADAIAAGNSVHVLFIDEETRDVHYTASDQPGRWSPSTVVVPDVNTQWVRGARIARNDGSEVYGFVIDAGSDGGSGMNRYGEVELRGTEPKSE